VHRGEVFPIAAAAVACGRVGAVVGRGEAAATTAAALGWGRARAATVAARRSREPASGGGGGGVAPTTTRAASSAASTAPAAALARAGPAVVVVGVFCLGWGVGEEGVRTAIDTADWLSLCARELRGRARAQELAMQSTH
jgi:hypothetical protein